MLYSAAYTKRRDLIHPQCPIVLEETEEHEELSILPQLCQSYNGRVHPLPLSPLHLNP